ncbi:unnamed protein product [Citrullus colocynthis]|uniref:Uncharacterized protein n=1 Tax=Citrullus colocynthis TaxID=252529 RepID=A0ABP0YZP5_9ROSI
MDLPWSLPLHLKDLWSTLSVFLAEMRLLASPFSIQKSYTPSLSTYSKAVIPEKRFVPHPKIKT